jgi:hypothetical protein
MFETKKTLIVVYKDELLMNQLKKMVETCDDNDDGVVGTKDNSINIVSWTEKVWLANKSAGNIQGKILFLGDIKGTAELIPVIDVKFHDCGVQYGWAGNQAVIFADTKALTKRADYDSFLEKLSELPIPSFLKKEKKDDSEVETTKMSVVEESINEIPTENEAPKFDLLKMAKGTIDAGVNLFGKVGNQLAVTSEELFRDKALMNRQMMSYGIVHLYYNDLELFMNS